MYIVFVYLYLYKYKCISTWLTHKQAQRVYTVGSWSRESGGSGPGTPGPWTSSYRLYIVYYLIVILTHNSNTNTCFYTFGAVKKSIITLCRPPDDFGRGLVVADPLKMFYMGILDSIHHLLV